VQAALTQAMLQMENAALALTAAARQVGGGIHAGSTAVAMTTGAQRVAHTGRRINHRISRR